MAKFKIEFEFERKGLRESTVHRVTEAMLVCLNGYLNFQGEHLGAEVTKVDESKAGKLAEANDHKSIAFDILT